jgi:hypothetical protein
MQAAQLADERAFTMLSRVQVLAAELPDPYLISRTLSRREGVDSSAIEETRSTLTALLTAEGDEDGARDAARQVRGYALTLDRCARAPRPRAATSSRPSHRGTRPRGDAP